MSIHHLRWKNTYTRLEYTYYTISYGDTQGVSTEFDNFFKKSNLADIYVYIIRPSMYAALLFFILSCSYLKLLHKVIGLMFWQN